MCTERTMRYIETNINPTENIANDKPYFTTYFEHVQGEYIGKIPAAF